MKSKGKVILGLWLAFILGAVATSIFGTVVSLVQMNQTLPNVGTVKGIGVGIYWNAACTNRTSTINWGLLEPSSNRTVTVYVRNEGNAAATLSQATANWNPSTASSHLSLTWNYAGQALNVNQVLQIRLTLIVSSTISGITSFSFDIVVTATG